MSALSNIINSHMVIVFFFYGLSFFTLGISISMQSRKGSEFKFGSSLWLLAGFGLLHGFNEWMDMFLLLGEDYWSARGVIFIEVFRFLIGKSSYLFLFQFGLQSYLADSKHYHGAVISSLSGYAVVILVLLIYGLVSGFSSVWFLHTDLLARYAFAFPGAVLTALSFWHQRTSRDILALKQPSIISKFTGGAVLFGLYAFLSGIIVKYGNFFPATIFNYENFRSVTGLPVQIFRALSAFGITYFVMGIMKVFELEKNRKLKLAYQEILKISTREQERIGQDIHDGLCQQLTGILLNTRALEAKMSKEGLSQAEELTSLNKYLDESISHARRVSKNLYPVEIEEQGLVFAIRDYCRSVEDLYGITCIADIEEGAAVEDHMAATHLFRIVQEAVNNAVKHGNAVRVKVELKSGGAELRIEDNGTGIPVHIEESSGMGINIMHYRSKVLGGKLTIERMPEGGTRVTCRT